MTLTSLICQFGIIFFGITAILCTQIRSTKANKWAPVFGLLGQPFWIVETVNDGKFGMVIITLIYTCVWGLGFYNRWIKK